LKVKEINMSEEKSDTEIDIMIEAKMKELSIPKLYEKYPQCDCKIVEKEEIYLSSGVIDDTWSSDL
jgi:hypothetical protein